MKPFTKTSPRAIAIRPFLLVYLWAALGAGRSEAASSKLTLSSSSSYLVDGFNWNKAKALSWVADTNASTAWMDKSCYLPNPGQAGPYALCLVFKGSGTPSLFNLNRITLGETNPVRYEAENADTRSGVSVVASSEGGQCVGDIQDNDYIVFNGVQLQARTLLTARVQSSGAAARIEIRLGNPGGKLLQTLQVANKNIPSISAAYPWRNCFCQRDISHQAEAAAVLGLNGELLSMWKAFARSATVSRAYYPLWEIDFDGKPTWCDYVSDTEFFREIPGPLDLVAKAAAAYKWSGDPRWINDPELTRMYANTTGAFIAAHDENGNGIPQEHTNDGMRGIGTYNEGDVSGLAESADGISTQWGAYQGYAYLLGKMGDAANADLMAKNAAALRDTFYGKWWDASNNTYYPGTSIPASANWVKGFYKGIQNFVLYYGLAEPGARANSTLKLLNDVYETHKADWNMEAYTYLPESFYKYGQNDRGWYWLKFIMDSKYNYPEISFLTLGSIVNGMMGIEPDAPNHGVATLGRLTSDLGWVQLDHIALGEHDLSVKHEDGNLTTTVKNGGSMSLTWEARFPGSYATVIVDGVPQAAQHKLINGIPVSYAIVTLGGGQQKKASASSTPLSTIPPGLAAGDFRIDLRSANGAWIGASEIEASKPGAGATVTSLVSRMRLPKGTYFVQLRTRSRDGKPLATRPPIAVVHE